MRFGLGLAAVVAVACSEGGVKSVNATPEAYITSHATGDTVREADTETVLGQVADANHALDELSVTWLYNGEVVCPDSAPDAAGSVSCDVTFSTEGGDVALTVRDPGGETATARVTLEVQATDAPTASIAAPTEDGVYYTGEQVTFEGTVADAEDAADALTVQWSSNLAGDLDGAFNTPDSEGNLLGGIALDEGEHFITLTATDTSGKEASDSVVITVGPPNSAPTCSITAPESGAAGPEGETVMFEGTASDVDVPANWLAVTWSSDKDGPIGESTPDSSGSVLFPFDGLSVNTHVITMTVTDEMGADCAANSVYAVGTPPVLTVTAPADGATLNHSDAVVFEATLTDNEDLPNEVTLSWESDLDGVFSTDGADSSGAATVSIDSLSPGDHVVTVTATDTDGLFVTDTVSFNLNQPPTTPTVTLEPDPAATNQMLVATASGSEDPEGTGTVTYAYEWFEDGVATAESASATFPASATGKNHTYRVQVTASDGLVDSAFGYAEVNVINSAPALVGPTLSVATATVGDVLTCTATATDLDPEDSPALTYAWHDGSTGPSYTVTMADAVDSTLTCTATADDADGGVTTGTATATVTNTAPTVDTVTVTPATGQVGDVLTCAATASDADGTTPDITYAWSDGSTGTSYTITTDDAVDSIITCTATATDAYGETGVGTATATVTNTAPTIDTVTVTPATGQVGDVLTCEATASDADGTTPDITYAWSDGSTGTSYTITADDAVDSTITCTATATDAYDATDVGTATATVTNTAPVMGTVSISPDPAYNNDTLACTATATDADGTAPDITYEWTGGATTRELPLTSIIAASGATLTCTATATDAYGATDGGTASITLGNRDPSVTAVITPEDPRRTDTLTCTATDATDPDDDATTVAFAWTVGGTDAAATSTDTVSTLDEPFAAGDTAVCTVTVTDGKGGSGSATTTVTVGNTPPVVSDATLVPSEVYTNDTVSAVATATDADGDALTLTYAFSVDGTVVQDGPESTLDGAVHFDKGETITVTVTASDGVAEGSDPSAGVVVRNTAPTAPTVSVVENSACEDGWSLMPNGDACAQAFRSSLNWTAAETDCVDRGGHLIRYFSDEDRDFAIDLFDISDGSRFWVGLQLNPDGASTSWTGGGDTTYIDSLAYWDDTSERCLEEAGTHVNDIPCTGLSRQGYVCEVEAVGPDGLVCTVDEESTDADGDPIAYTFDWDVDGEPFTAATTSSRTGDTVSGDELGYNELWTCTVIPNDGEANGDSGTAEYEQPCYGYESTCPAASCKAILDAGYSEGSGIYWLDPDEDGFDPFEVYCDMSATYEGGGWTMVSVHSDDNDHNWTFENSTYMTTSDVTFGSLDTRNRDYRSLAFVDLAITEMLFIHQPSGIWAKYNTGTSRMSIGAFIDSFGGLVDYSSGVGLPMEAGTLTAAADVCSTDLFINPRDGDGPAGSPSGDHAWGPAWSTNYNHGCPLDDPGVRGSLGPAVSGPSFEWNPGEGPPGRSVGFGYSLGVNTGAGGAAENYMQVYVR